MATLVDLAAVPERAQSSAQAFFSVWGRSERPKVRRCERERTICQRLAAYLSASSSVRQSTTRETIVARWVEPGVSGKVLVAHDREALGSEGAAKIVAPGRQGRRPFRPQ
jgi:hypothetical protein